MKDFNEILKHCQDGMGALGQDLPKVMQAFGGLHQAAGHDGALDTKTKELIAMAIAVVIRCEGCIAFHVNDAINAGATREEIMDALGVAILMGGGPSVVYSIEAMDALNEYTAELTA